MFRNRGPVRWGNLSLTQFDCETLGIGQGSPHMRLRLRCLIPTPEQPCQMPRRHVIGCTTSATQLRTEFLHGLLQWQTTVTCHSKCWFLHGSTKFYPRTVEVTWIAPEANATSFAWTGLKTWSPVITALQKNRSGFQLPRSLSAQTSSKIFHYPPYRMKTGNHMRLAVLLNLASAFWFLPQHQLVPIIPLWLPTSLEPSLLDEGYCIIYILWLLARAAKRLLKLMQVSPGSGERKRYGSYRQWSWAHFWCSFITKDM